MQGIPNSYKETKRPSWICKEEISRGCNSESRIGIPHFLIEEKDSNEHHIVHSTVYHTWALYRHRPQDHPQTVWWTELRCTSGSRREVEVSGRQCTICTAPRSKREELQDQGFSLGVSQTKPLYHTISAPPGGVFCAHKIEFTGVYRIGSCIQIADRNNTEILAYSA
jgi:hypothetical protein